MKCTECEHFKIAYKPIGHFDSGMARCKKYDLVVDYISKQKLNKLVCVKDKEREE